MPRCVAYHPDKVANLPEEFQQLAHQKTIEIREAYEALLKVVGQRVVVTVAVTRRALTST
ncbi:MAG: hypothetical protein WCF10_05090 [Polyangiales bacterium]